MPLKGFFDVLKSILTKDTVVLRHEKDVDEVTDSSSWWVLDRYFSMVPDMSTAVIVNLLQKYGTQFEKMEYIRFLYFNMPKKNNQFIKYMKKGKDDASKLEELSIPCIIQHFTCSKIQAREYFQLLDEREILEIANFYGEKYPELRKFLGKKA